MQKNYRVYLYLLKRAEKLINRYLSKFYKQIFENNKSLPQFNYRNSLH